jgi:hypothetical protein
MTVRRILAASCLALAFVAAANAQGRGRDDYRTQGIPPGHLPPPGECRVWYDGRPPGQQPPPTSCRDAERIAARSRHTRVIYGDDRGERRAQRRYPYPDARRYPDDRYPDSTRRSTNGVPFDNGYRDGYDAGREDARANRRHDPTRNSEYRTASRGYDPRYGSRDEYRDRYREGFRAGYSDGYDDYGTRDQRGGWRFPWPF